jgi:hypothetical protein
MTMYALRNTRVWGAMAVGVALFGLGVAAWRAERRRASAAVCPAQVTEGPRRWQLACARQLIATGAAVQLQQAGEHALVEGRLTDYTVRVVDRVANLDDSAWETISAGDELYVEARREGDRTARLTALPHGSQIEALRAALDTCLETDQ